MMDALKAIATRRSVRKYTEEAISDEVLRQILAAGMSGPSAGDQRPWQFLVLQDRERLDALAAVPAYRRPLGAAPLAIVVCADMEISKYGDNWIIDCAIATQNILLAAHALGLGAAWLSCYYTDDRLSEARRILGVPDNVIPFAVVPIGVPAEQPAPVERYAADRVHVDAW